MRSWWWEQLGRGLVLEGGFDGGREIDQGALAEAPGGFGDGLDDREVLATGLPLGPEAELAESHRLS